ncbi:hypothetical protein B0H13DRAFT_1911168 [Mycena leptocephala]|nr:hypothetical protein B0H13DRAFT_1911168 [Mycena leptocephala]
MASLDITIGCLLIASWANMILFTLQGVQYGCSIFFRIIFREISQRLHHFPCIHSPLSDHILRYMVQQNIGAGCLSFGFYDRLRVFVGELLVPGNSLGQRSKVLTKVTTPVLIVSSARRTSGVSHECFQYIIWIRGRAGCSLRNRTCIYKVDTEM